jgi:arylsulfatase A-like enzyme
MKNIILITLDATRKDVFGLYGNPKGLTPFMDSLKERSLLFSKCQSAGPYTQASFPGILGSGYYLDYGKPAGLAPERIIISEVLKKAGLFTAAFHSNPYCSSLQGWDRDWDVFYDSLDDDLEDERIPYIRGDLINKKVIAWLSSYLKRNSARPFFLWMHYMDVHEPYMPEKKFIDLVDPSIPVDQEAMYELFENTLLKREVSDPEKVSLLKRLYEVHVREVDTYVESFFRFLDGLGLLKETVIIITSDHGDEFNEHGGLSHDDQCYSELIDVPLLIYGTGQTSESHEVVSSLDISPTILNLLGIESPSFFRGESLLSAKPNPNRVVFGEAINQKSMKGGDINRDIYYCRQGDMKLIVRGDTGRTELYNLKEDPGERKNIAESSAETPSLMEKLKPRIRRWIKEGE